MNIRTLSHQEKRAFVISSLLSASALVMMMVVLAADIGRPYNDFAMALVFILGAISLTPLLKIKRLPRVARVYVLLHVALFMVLAMALLLLTFRQR